MTLFDQIESLETILDDLKAEMDIQHKLILSLKPGQIIYTNESQWGLNANEYVAVKVISIDKVKATVKVQEEGLDISTTIETFVLTLNQKLKRKTFMEKKYLYKVKEGV